jgi:thiamine biosynthesis lipoprotein
VVVAMPFLVGTGASADADAFVTIAQPIMSTRVEVTLRQAQEHHADEVFAVFRDAEAMASEWQPSSPLSGVNAAAGAPVPVPQELRALLGRGVSIGEMTGGAFDITGGALWGLWDFKAEEPRVPDTEEVTRRVALVDYRQVEIDDAGGTVRLMKEGMVVGLGGIAKGWALDRSVVALLEQGVSDFSLSAGGQVVVGGVRGDRPWRVGIRDPRGAPDDYFAIVEASNVSVSTSGDYERFFVQDGVRYHHILDPRTGMPARGLRSATVITPDATLAYALSTALVVMGVDRGLALVEQLSGVEAFVVDERGHAHRSTGARYHEVHPPRER